MKIFTFLFGRTFWMLTVFVVISQSMQAQQFTLGSQAYQSSNSFSGISPYTYYWESSHAQFVYRAAELAAAGASAGNITHLAFDISELALGNPALLNYEVKMKHTTATNPNSYDGTGLTTVFGPASYQPLATGFYDLTFATPFTWNGIDNILVDVCWGVNTGSSASGRVWIYADAVGGAPGMKNITNSSTNQCGNPTNTYSFDSRKPRVRFTIVCSGTPSPGNTLASINPVCNGNTTLLSPQNNPQLSGLTYQWYNGAGAISGATGSTYTPTITSADNYYCVVTCTNSGQSASSTILNVGVNPNAALPALVSPATSPTTICSGSTATLEAAALADHTIEWRWFTGAFGGPMATSTSNPLTTPALTTNRTYYAYQQNTLTGCWSEIGTVARLNISALPSALAGADRLVCPGTNTQVGPASAVSGWTYSWTPSNLLSSTTANRPTVQNVPVDYNQDYTLTVTNALGCTATDIVNVSARSITNLLAATDAGSGTAVCAGQPAVIGSAPTAGFTYTWTPFAALNNRFSSMPTHLFNNTSSTVANVTTYTLTVRETATGCAATDQVVVTTNPLPAAIRVNAGTDQTIVQGGSTVIGGANPVAGLSYSWSPAMGLSSAMVAKPTANPTSTTTYTITVSNSFGCSRSDDMTLTVNPVRTGVFGDKVEVVVYPNPVKDALHLSSNLPMDGNLSILVVNGLGQTVMGRELGLSGNTLNEEIDTRNLAQGVYTVIVRSAEGESSFKIVKE